MRGLPWSPDHCVADRKENGGRGSEHGGVMGANDPARVSEESYAPQKCPSRILKLDVAPVRGDAKFLLEVVEEGFAVDCVLVGVDVIEADLKWL